MAKEDGKSAKAELMKILLEDSDDTGVSSESSPILSEPEPTSTDVMASRTKVTDLRVENEASPVSHALSPPISMPPTQVLIPTDPPEERLRSETATRGELTEASKATSIAPLRRTLIRQDAPVSDPSHMAQAEHLRIAQERILELETLIENLRIDNEQLSSAGETLRDRNDELSARLETLEQRLKEQTENYERERSIMDVSIKAKGREVNQLKLKIEELENRLQQDLRKVRVRERELENIIEIVRAEHAAVQINKDEMILNLKRKIDELNHQLENQMNRTKEQDRALQSDQDRIKRTVKALRLALSMLEAEDSEVPFKKAGG